MKAFLLAGGHGERLRPLTYSTPKCLVPIIGQPLLGIWLTALGHYGIDEVLVNVSRHPEQVEAFIAKRKSPPRVTVVRELQPIGNAGTVAANRAFVDDQTDFWIIYSDNLSTADLGAVRTFHLGHRGLLTMALFEAQDPRQAGVVTVEPDGRIGAFAEKPDRPAGTLANAGIYLARRELLDFIPVADTVVDFGLHVFPRLVGRLYGYRVDGLHIDIGTPQGLHRANQEAARLDALSREERGSSR